MMITGDNNLVELQATVQYRITQPHVYLFQVGDANEVIRASAESVLRGLVVGRPFLELLTVNRAQFQKDVLARIEQRCRAYGSSGLGIEFDSLALKDLHPPADVVQAYYDVARAMEGHRQMVNNAQASALRKVQTAEADSRRVILRAEAGKTEKIKQADAERVTFLAKSGVRKELSLEQEMSLTMEAVDEALGASSPAEAEARYQKRRQELVAAQAALTDFRLFWEALTQALTGRDLVLIDADKVSGRRNLLLLDPDLLRVPVPMFLPPDRSPPERAPFRPKNEEDEGP
jgi:regulator of protease activity HflC (stomatin/prohibitin superfamily)